MLTIPQGQERRQSSCRALPALATVDMLPNPRAATCCTLVRVLGVAPQETFTQQGLLETTGCNLEVSKGQISEHSSLQSKVLHPQVSVEQEGRERLPLLPLSPPPKLFTALNTQHDGKSGTCQHPPLYKFP